MVTIIHLSHLILEEVCSFKTLDIMTLSAQELLEQLPIMHQYVNIDLDSFQMKNLSALVVNIPLNQDDTYFTSAEDITSIGT